MNLTNVRMSYVIQNFYKPIFKFSPSKNSILFFECKNLHLLFIFFRFFEMYRKIPFKIFLVHRWFDVSKLQLFDKNYIFFYNLFKINTSFHQTTKFQKSLRLYALQNLNKLFVSKKPRVFPIRWEKKIIFNSYFFTEQVIFFWLKNTIFQPMFLYFLLQLPQQWPIFSELFIFGSTYVRILPYFKLIYFENKRIFKTQRL